MVEKRRRCPVSPCPAELPQGLLMCKEHWRQVPKPLQAGVNKAWRHLRRVLAGSRSSTDALREAAGAHREATDAAVQAVERQRP
ncbi:MAG: hypothetical protein WD341_08705 [Tistlia sp.]|uniref:hypothetical protein n=1 Tax=Tistlia sp. TaxID=3057121 RepID=UPI0034A1853F